MFRTDLLSIIRILDDGQSVCPKHVKFFTKIKLRIVHLVGVYYKNAVLTLANIFYICIPTCFQSRYSV